MCVWMLCSYQQWQGDQGTGVWQRGMVSNSRSIRPVSLLRFHGGEGWGVMFLLATRANMTSLLELISICNLTSSHSKWCQHRSLLQKWPCICPLSLSISVFTVTPLFCSEAFSHWLMLIFIDIVILILCAHIYENIDEKKSRKPFSFKKIYNCTIIVLNHQIWSTC